MSRSASGVVARVSLGGGGTRRVTGSTSVAARRRSTDGGFVRWLVADYGFETLDALFILLVIFLLLGVMLLAFLAMSAQGLAQMLEEDLGRCAREHDLGADAIVGNGHDGREPHVVLGDRRWIADP